MMQTMRWNLDNKARQNLQAINDAVALLKKGSIVAFPTETVYGLGADATNEAAVAKIFQAKGRPQDNPLIVHVATKDQLMELVTEIPLFAEKLMDTFSPGPLTFVLPSNGACARNVTAGLSTIAVRIPNHPVALQLLGSCNVPLAAPSANISGKPSPTTGDHVWSDLVGKIAGLLDGGPTGVGVESTVIDCTQDKPIILRPGGITKEQIEAVVGTVMIDPALANALMSPKSPGMKYKHYSPEVPLWLVEGSYEKIQAVINKERVKSKRVGVLASAETIQLLNADQFISLGKNITNVAANLYDALRTFKKDEIDLIICETFPEIGIGQAVMNRLKKAATIYVRS